MRSRLRSVLSDWRFWVATIVLVTVEQLTRKESQLIQLVLTTVALLAALVAVVTIEMIVGRKRD